jgi:3-isopropylmalate/(R)-2-methylmalate dehydratase small subunit
MAIERIQRLCGRAIPLRGDNIDTDRIIPARFLKSITFEGLEDHLFEDDRASVEGHPVSNPAFRGATLLLVNANFGCGSSREHAPQAIRRRGIRALVGESYSEIFFGNSVALGMPCLTAARDDLNALMAAAEREPSIEFVVDLEPMTVTGGGLSVRVSLPPGARESFLDGAWDATALLLDRFEDVESVSKRLPYISGW